MGSKKPICLYGTGDAAERILDIFSDLGLKCYGIFASSGFVRERSFRGFKVSTAEELEQQFGDFTAVCAFGSQLSEIMDSIDRISERHELFLPDLPVAGNTRFTASGLLERYDEYTKLSALLADSLSRKTLDAVLKYKITGKLKFLKDIFSDLLTDLSELIAPRPGEIYADLGAYNGDSCERFADICPKYSHIYAFEPDMRSFRKCVRRLERFDRLTILNACAWDHDTRLGFLQSAGRQSQITKNAQLMQARSLDSVLCGKECTFIKYDVEGAESHALSGSAQTIKRFRPRLAISAYHRPYDLFDLSRQLLDIRSDYSIYLRQPPYYPSWDTMLYAI